MDQRSVSTWVISTFGESAMHPTIRAMRFLEEAIELVQACGLTLEEVDRVAGVVYSRPVGEVSQEVGGTRLTLAALCEAMHVDGDIAATVEWDRVQLKSPEYVRARDAAKRALGLERPNGVM